MMEYINSIMHGTIPAIELNGPTDPRAFENLCIMQCPPYADALCPVCKGHGAYNVVLNAGGPMRHKFVDCDNCNGDGWVERDGEHHMADIVLINGRPQWVITLCPETAITLTPKRPR